LRFNSECWQSSKLGELFIITSVLRVHESDWSKDGVRFYRARDIVSIFNNEVFEPLHISRELYERFSKKCGKIEAGNLLVTGVGTIGIPYLVKAKDEFYFKDGNIIWLKNSVLNGEFLYYSFQSKPIVEQIKASSGLGTVGTYTIESANRTLIRYPSYKSQEKIGRFLSLIDLRIQTQNKILNGLESLRFSLSYILFRHLDRYSKLEDIANIIKGKQINGDILNEGFSYPVYNGGINASGFYNKFNSENCITISEGGNSCGTVRFVKDKFWSGGHNYVIVCKNGIIDQFLYYYLKHNENKIMSLRVGSGLPNIQKSSLGEFKIKITNIEEQKKIAAKLGAIDSKINNEKKLLELFQKQKHFLLNNLFI